MRCQQAQLCKYLCSDGTQNFIRGNSVYWNRLMNGSNNKQEFLLRKQSRAVNL